MAQSNLDVVVRARAEGLGAIDQLNDKIGGFRSSIRGATFLLRTFGVSLSAVFSGAIIRGFIRSQNELANSVARTRFVLQTLGRDTGGLVERFSQFGMEMQRAGIASTNLAREVGARGFRALRDFGKATEFARVALLGHKLELFDGDTKNWKLYDDDSTTLLFEWNVTDKNDSSIVQESNVDSKRTKGS